MALANNCTLFDLLQSILSIGRGAGEDVRMRGGGARGGGRLREVHRGGGRLREVHRGEL